MRNANYYIFKQKSKKTAKNDLFLVILSAAEGPQSRLAALSVVERVYHKNELFLPAPCPYMS